MKRSPLTIVVALLLMVIFGLTLFVFQVRQSEVAVITLFDKMESGAVRTNPGPHLQWPWPIERVYKLDQRVHSLEDKLEQVTLPDQNVIMLLTYVGWRISDPAQFFPKFENGSIFRAEDQLQGIVRSAKLEVASKHNFSDFLSADQSQIKFAQIENDILESARQKTAVGNYGIEIKFVQIKSIELPSAVSQAVFDRMKAERSTLVNAIQANANQRSIEIRSEADSAASKLLAEADAQAMKIRGEGEKAKIQSLQIMAQKPDFAKFLMDLDMLEELSKDKTTWIFDHNSSGLELLQAAKPPGAGTNAAVPGHN
ncbi:MAG TPA: protease modulator HflC [Candidatus Acidoferrum sp.]|nr:protease modulator HflC [Candidatus Acidoferrum sp.]